MYVLGLECMYVQIDILILRIRHVIYALANSALHHRSHKQSVKFDCGHIMDVIIRIPIEGMCSVFVIIKLIWRNTIIVNAEIKIICIAKVKCKNGKTKSKIKYNATMYMVKQKGVFFFAPVG